MRSPSHALLTGLLCWALLGLLASPWAAGLRPAEGDAAGLGVVCSTTQGLRAGADPQAPTAHAGGPCLACLVGAGLAPLDAVAPPLREDLSLPPPALRRLPGRAVWRVAAPPARGPPA